MRHPLQMLQAGIRHLRVEKPQPAELTKLPEMFKPGAGHLGVGESETSEFG